MVNTRSSSVEAIYAITVFLSVSGGLLGTLAQFVVANLTTTERTHSLVSDLGLGIATLFVTLLFAILFAAATGTVTALVTWLSRRLGLSSTARGVSAAVAALFGYAVYVVVAGAILTTTIVVTSAIVAIFGAVWIGVAVRYHERALSKRPPKG